MDPRESEELNRLEDDLAEYRDEETSLTKSERDWLLEEKLLGDYAQGEAEVEDISRALDSFRSGRASVAPRSTRPRERRLDPNHQSLAFAEITAIEAERDPAVIAFRSEVLEGQLIDYAAIGDWVTSTAKSDGPPTQLVTLPVDAERIPQTLAEATEGLGMGRGPRFTRILVRYPDAERRNTHAELVAMGGVLDRLQLIAERLERSYGWGEADSVAFILTGAGPPAIRGRVSVSHHFGSLRASTVTITVNPDWVAPKDVARIYLEAVTTDEMTEVRGQPGAGRPMEEKSAQLAVFSARHADTGTWPELMGRWNDEHPDWEYTDPRRFGRDSRRAYERVTKRLWKDRNEP